MLTKNNEKTIKKTIESIICDEVRIIVGDLGSEDATVSICKKHNIEVFNFRETPRNEIRKVLASKHSGAGFWIEPWEELEDVGQIKQFKGQIGFATIIKNGMVSFEERIWNGPVSFINPIFEKIDCKKSEITRIKIFSNGELDKLESIKELDNWSLKDPLSYKPIYYKACIELSLGKYEEFLKNADCYFFLNQTNDDPSIMMRYYYAMVYLIHKKSHRPALQNLNVCLSKRPLMAEAWCLTGDVFYHLLRKFDFAKEFYENAIILGAKRLSSDKMPMDVEKYRIYPEKMIESCNSLLKSPYLVSSK